MRLSVFGSMRTCAPLCGFVLLTLLKVPSWNLICSPKPDGAGWRILDTLVGVGNGGEAGGDDCGDDTDTVRTANLSVGM
jgi:hypothetical protein